MLMVVGVRGRGNRRSGQTRLAMEGMRSSRFSPRKLKAETCGARSGRRALCRRAAHVRGGGTHHPALLLRALASVGVHVFRPLRLAIWQHALVDRPGDEEAERDEPDHQHEEAGHVRRLMEVRGEVRDPAERTARSLAHRSIGATCGKRAVAPEVVRAHHHREGDEERRREHLRARAPAVCCARVRRWCPSGQGRP